MRRNYHQPATEVAEVMMDSQILSGSPTPKQGISASRNGYGEGGTETW